MAHMHVTGIENEPPQPLIEVSSEPIAEISATLLRAQAFLSGCGIALLVREGAWLACRASNGAAAPDIGTRLPVENTFLGLCVTLKKPQSCENADADLRVENATYSRLRPKSILAVPVRAGQDVIAVLGSFSSAPNAFTHTQVAILRTVADSLSRPVQQLPAALPPSDPPASQSEPWPSSPRDSLQERAAKPEPQPVQQLPLSPPPSDPPASQPEPWPSSPRDSLQERAAKPQPQPVQKVPVASPPSDPPPSQPEPWPTSPRDSLQERAAKPQPQPVPPPAQPVVLPAPREEVLTLADEPAPPPRPPELRPPELRLSPPSVRVVTYSVPKSFELARPRPRRLRPVLLRITAVTAACLLCALATAGWYSTRIPAAPGRLAAIPLAPTVIPSPTHAEPPAGPAPELMAAPAAKEPTLAESKLHAVAPAHAEPQPAKSAAAEPPQPAKPSAAEPLSAEIAAPKLRQAAPMAEPPALALEASSALPALVAPHATAPKIHHSVATPARLEYRVSPQYPMAALTRRIAGQVTLSLLVRKDGSVAEIKQISGNPLFRDSAVDAVKHWRYSPATLDGDPVEATAQVVLKFDLPADRR